MRKFGTDKPELMSFTFGNSDKVYNIPLAASVPAPTILEMNDEYKKGEMEAFAWQVKFLRTYVGELVDEMTTGDIKDIFDAWMVESSGQGAEVGESLASSESSTNTDEH